MLRVTCAALAAAFALAACAPSGTVPPQAVPSSVGTSEPVATPTAMPATTPPAVRPTTAAPTAPSPTASRVPSPPSRANPIVTNRKCETPPPTSTGGHPRAVTAAAPLDLLLTGDSLQESSGPQLVALANSREHVVAGCTVPKYSTGLVRDDFFDWPAYARQLAASRDPEAVSFMIGGNDGQNMSIGGRVVQAGSPEWAAEYERRAALVMRAFTAGGRRTVYWIGMPIARSDRLTGIYRVLNDSVRKAAAREGVRFVDIWAMFAPHGRYADSFANEFGQVQRMRSSDGIHLSVAGAAYLARRMLGILNADWHLTG